MFKFFIFYINFIFILFFSLFFITYYVVEIQVALNFIIGLYDLYSYITKKKLGYSLFQIYDPASSPPCMLAQFPFCGPSSKFKPFQSLAQFQSQVSNPIPCLQPQKCLAQLQALNLLPWFASSYCKLICKNGTLNAPRVVCQFSTLPPP